MKKLLICLFALTIVLNVGAQVKKTVPVVNLIPVKTKVPVLKSLLDSFSYMAGYNVATNMKAQGITDVNTAIMQKGLEDFFKNKTPLISPEIGNASMKRQLDIFMAKKAALEKIKTDSMKAKGVAFLANNKKRKEIITLPDGLQYEIIKSGDSIAHKPRLIDTVVVNYIGTHIDGKEFENSFKNGQPAIFAVNRVIKGWVEILQLMPVGSYWKVYIPTELAYGDNPPPSSSIAPGDVLIFEISLEGIKSAIEKPKDTTPKN